MLGERPAAWMAEYRVHRYLKAVKSEDPPAKLLKMQARKAVRLRYRFK